MKRIVETERLFARELTNEDFSELSGILQDIEVMYAWEHSFSDDEVKEWINNNIKRYKGFR